MRRVNASEFKARCLAMIDDVAATGEPLEILKRGRPVARLIRSDAAGHEFPQRSLRGTVRHLGDVVAPAAPLRDWNAERR